MEKNEKILILGLPDTGKSSFIQALDEVLKHPPTLLATDPEMKGFSEAMKVGGFKPKFIKVNDQWSGLDIKSSALGGSSIFNTCNFGVLSTHGCFGTTTEIDGIKYTYFLMHNEEVGVSSYVRLSDMDFGSADPSGLRWMTILSCDSLHPANVTSMRNNGKFPMNDNLHLLLGATTVTYADPRFGFLYASNLVSSVTIKQSLINAGQIGYALSYANLAANRAMMTNAVTFRVMGYDSCIGDTLYLYNDPDSGTTFQIQDTTVFTPSP